METWHKCFAFLPKAIVMSTKENKEVVNAQTSDTKKTVTPLSETIENAHASGDGSLERDKDTIIPAKEGEQTNDSRSPNSGNDAY
mgnify:CR=1 FL=1